MVDMIYIVYIYIILHIVYIDDTNPFPLILNRTPPPNDIHLGEFLILEVVGIRALKLPF